MMPDLDGTKPVDEDRFVEAGSSSAAYLDLDQVLADLDREASDDSPSAMVSEPASTDQIGQWNQDSVSSANPELAADWIDVHQVDPDLHRDDATLLEQIEASMPQPEAIIAAYDLDSGAASSSAEFRDDIAAQLADTGNQFVDKVQQEATARHLTLDAVQRDYQAKATELGLIRTDSACIQGQDGFSVGLLAFYDAVGGQPSGAEYAELAASNDAAAAMEQYQALQLAHNQVSDSMTPAFAEFAGREIGRGEVVWKELSTEQVNALTLVQTVDDLRLDQDIPKLDMVEDQIALNTMREVGFDHLTLDDFAREGNDRLRAIEMEMALGKLGLELADPEDKNIPPITDINGANVWVAVYQDRDLDTGAVGLLSVGSSGSPVEPDKQDGFAVVQEGTLEETYRRADTLLDMANTLPIERVFEFGESIVHGQMSLDQEIEDRGIMDSAREGEDDVAQPSVPEYEPELEAEVVGTGDWELGNL